MRCLLVSLGVVLTGITGCAGVRGPAKEATQGAISGAREAATQQKLSPIIREAIEGGIEGLAAVAENPQQRRRLQQAMRMMAEAMGPALAEMRPELRQTMREMMLGMIDAMYARQNEIGALMQQISAQAGQGLAAGMASEMRTQMGTSGDGPMAQSLNGVARSASAALAGGMLTEMGSRLGPCEGGDAAACAQDRVRRLTSAAGAGLAGGLGDEMGVWRWVLAFALGVLATLLVGAAVRYLLLPHPRRPPVLVTGRTEQGAPA